MGPIAGRRSANEEALLKRNSILAPENPDHIDPFGELIGPHPYIRAIPSTFLQKGSPYGKDLITGGAEGGTDHFPIPLHIPDLEFPELLAAVL